MDPLVLAGMAKWPNVPAVYGWLQLTARGQWRLLGQPIDNANVRAFIDRNYAVDAAGRAYFQNGPQRVYVDLERTPWVYRLGADGRVSAHTGAQPRRCSGGALLDDGSLLLLTDLGPGTIDDRDAAHALRAVTDYTGLVLNERGFERWMEGRDEAFIEPRLLGLAGERKKFERVPVATLPEHYGFVARPRE